MVKNNDKLTIICDETIDKNVFDLFYDKLKVDYINVKDWFGTKYDSLSLTLVSKNNLNLIVQEKSEQYQNKHVPDWLVGFSNFEEVWVVIPTSETLNELVKVALHELIHLMSYSLGITYKRVKILDEGIAVFLSNQYKGKIYTPWVNAYLNKKLPKVSDLCTYDGIEFSEKRWI